VGVAATGTWVDPDGVRQPAGEVHGWSPGQNSTVCGLQLGRSGLVRFAGVEWRDVQPASGGRADAVQAVCPRCAAGLGGRASTGRRWTRDDPRP
jgi:hypothetical protein